MGRRFSAFLGLRLQRMRRGRALLPHRRPLLRLGRPRAQTDVLAVLLQPLRRAEQGLNSTKECLIFHFRSVIASNIKPQSAASQQTSKVIFDGIGTQSLGRVRRRRSPLDHCRRRPLQERRLLDGILPKRQGR